MKYLKEQSSEIQGVLADPVGSVIGSGEHADYEIEGIGNDFIADTMDMSLVDRVIKVNDDEAFAASRLLAAKEGILAGSSSGAALAASLRLAKTIERGNIVVVFPDRGDRYLSKGLFDKKIMDSRTDPEKVGKKEVILGHLIGPLGTIFVVNTSMRAISSR